MTLLLFHYTSRLIDLFGKPAYVEISRQHHLAYVYGWINLNHPNFSRIHLHICQSGQILQLIGVQKFPPEWIDLQFDQL